MVTEVERQEIVDEEQLRLLPVFYWVLGGLDLFFSLYGLIYVAMGVLFVTLPYESTSAGDTSPAFMGWFFALIGLAFMLGFAGSAALKIATGTWIKRRKHRTFCLVVAGVSCLSMPFGTIAGVFTFLVLLRPSVAARFAVVTRPQSLPPEDPAGVAEGQDDEASVT